MHSMAYFTFSSMALDASISLANSCYALAASSFQLLACIN